MLRLFFSRLAAGVFYVAIGLWTGLVGSMAITPVAAFNSARGMQPTIQAGPYAQPELQLMAADIIAGEIVGRVVLVISYAGIVCLITAILALAVRAILHWCQSPHRVTQDVIRLASPGPDVPAPAEPRPPIESPRRRAALRAVALLRIALLAALVAVTTYQGAVVNPRVFDARAMMYDTRLADDVRTEARDRFDIYHQQSTRVGQILLITLALTLLISPLADEAHRLRRG